jgi:hypothetical protein
MPNKSMEKAFRTVGTYLPRTSYSKKCKNLDLVLFSSMHYTERAVPKYRRPVELIFLDFQSAKV